MTDQPEQLDLTASSVDVPQASGVPLLIALLEAIEADVCDGEALAERLDVERRTVHYYLDLARWLQFIGPGRGSDTAFSDTGFAFVESETARGRLFAHAVHQNRVVQLARELADQQELELRAACELAIVRLTNLGDATAARRASSLAHLMVVASAPDRIDWGNGRELDAYRRALFEAPGRSFLTALAASKFSSARELRIGFPTQVLHFLEAPAEIDPDHWPASSYTSHDGSAVWFGSLPVNDSTLAIVRRGGRDLRKLLVSCVPYVTLAVRLLSYRDATRRHAVTLTEDMYGARFWFAGRELGEPMEVIERFAKGLGLQPVLGLPSDLAHDSPSNTGEGTSAELVAVLRRSELVQVHDTTHTLPLSVLAELREGNDLSPSLFERLKPLESELDRLLDLWVRGVPLD